MQTMEIPTTVYIYREIKGYGEYVYKLEQIINKKDSITYSHDFIEKNYLNESGMTQLEIFNRIYIPEVNQKALKFAFRCESGLYICSPTPYGRLDITGILDKDCDYDGGSGGHNHNHHDGHSDHDMAAAAHDKALLLSSSDLAFSMYTVIHDYIETRNNNNVFYHVGTSPFPCTPIFIPTWVSNKTLCEILWEWGTCKMDVAKRESMVVVRCATGLTTVKKISDGRSQKKKWKPLLAANYC